MLILIVSFLHNFAFNAGTFYLALYFQVSHPSLSVVILLTAILGCERFVAVGGGSETSTVFPRLLVGFYASGLVYRILAKKKSQN